MSLFTSSLGASSRFIAATARALFASRSRCRSMSSSKRGTPSARGTPPARRRTSRRGRFNSSPSRRYLGRREKREPATCGTVSVARAGSARTMFFRQACRPSLSAGRRRFRAARSRTLRRKGSASRRWSRSGRSSRHQGGPGREKAVAPASHRGVQRLVRCEDVVADVRQPRGLAWHVLGQRLRDDREGR